MCIKEENTQRYLALKENCGFFSTGFDAKDIKDWIKIGLNT